MLARSDVELRHTWPTNVLRQPGADLRELKRSATTAVSVLLLAACGTAGGTGATTVNATFTDNSIVISQASVPSGKVTFNVKNTGTMVHELAVLQTNLAHDKIPPDPAAPGKVLEENDKGETGDMNVGETKTFTVDLAPGNYVLICNQPAHYLLGMHIAFVVK